MKRRSSAAVTSCCLARWYRTSVSVRGKPGSVGLEHRVIGGSSPHALEEAAAILQARRNSA